MANNLGGVFHCPEALSEKFEAMYCTFNVPYVHRHHLDHHHLQVSSVV